MKKLLTFFGCFLVLSSNSGLFCKEKVKAKALISINDYEIFNSVIDEIEEVPADDVTEVNEEESQQLQLQQGGTILFNRPDYSWLNKIYLLQKEKLSLQCYYDQLASVSLYKSELKKVQQLYEIENEAYSPCWSNVEVAYKKQEQFKVLQAEMDKQQEVEGSILYKNYKMKISELASVAQSLNTEFASERFTVDANVFFSKYDPENKSWSYQVKADSPYFMSDVKQLYLDYDVLEATYNYVAPLIEGSRIAAKIDYVTQFNGEGFDGEFVTVMSKISLYDIESGKVVCTINTHDLIETFTYESVSGLIH